MLLTTNGFLFLLPRVGFDYEPAFKYLGVTVVAGRRFKCDSLESKHYLLVFNGLAGPL